MTRSGPATIAILNTNDDTVEMLRILIETEGMVAVSAHLSDMRRGQLDFAGFLKEHDPAVVIYDVAPPYDRSLLFLQHLKALPAMKHRKVVLTSTNPARVQQTGAPDEQVYEVIGKPYDLKVIVDAVKTALEQ